MMHVASGPVRHTGIYQIIERPRRLAFTWNSIHAGENDSLVTVEFLASGDSTEIVLTHERLPSDALAGHNGGWTDILNGLARSMGEKSA